jgi:hypothetical protein
MFRESSSHRTPLLPQPPFRFSSQKSLLNSTWGADRHDDKPQNEGYPSMLQDLTTEGD